MAVSGALDPFTPSEHRTTSPMETLHIPLLRRVGAVLLAVGLILLAALGGGLLPGAAYTGGLGLGAVAAGVLVGRGSLRTALWLRWCAALWLAAGLSLLFFLPLMQPFSLTFAQLRLGQGPSPLWLAGAVLGVGLMAWLVWQLGRAPIQAAWGPAGLAPRDLRIPSAAGVGLVLALGVFVVAMRVGAPAQQARALAEQAVGDGYRFHIVRLRREPVATGTRVTAVVTAWNESEIRRIPVQWEQP
jgi:hypothetical protein